MSIPGAVAGADWPEALARPASAEPAPGGWVARTYLAVLADGTRAVVKLTPYPADAEVDGLNALARAGVPVPEVLGHRGGTLVLRRVGGPPGWETLGRAVAGMHRVTHPRFGWHRDNRMGLFVQPNAWSDDWPRFFVENRVRTHLSDPRVPPELALRVARACDGPMAPMLAGSPWASLTHGDLWRGNVVDGRWVVDPEVSFADRELDLAYMLMSRDDPLPGEFWGAYREELPFRDGFEDRRRLLELHHRLLGVRHFGERAAGPLHELLTELGW